MNERRNDLPAVSFSVSVYRSLVRLYPASFRDTYGPLMIQAFRDNCLGVTRGGGTMRLLSLWAFTVFDVLVSVMEQHANRGVMMTQSKWIQLSGWLLALSGLVLLAGFAASSRPTYNEYNAASWPVDRYLNAAKDPVIVLGLLCLAIGLVGLRARFGGQVGAMGRTGLSISLVGTAVALVGIIGIGFQDSSPWWETSMLGVTSLFVGLFFFGLGCIRTNSLGRWSLVPLVIGLLWPLLLSAEIVLNPVVGSEFETPDAIVTLVLVISCTGLALIGYLLQSDVTRSQTALS